MNEEETGTENNEGQKDYVSLLGIAEDCELTVEKFLEWKREEREREYEQEKRLWS